MNSVLNTINLFILCFWSIHTISSENRIKIPEDSSINRFEIPDRSDTTLQQAIINYMECEECTDGELNSLLYFGQQAIPYLIDILKYGPSEKRKSDQKKHLDERYLLLKQRKVVEVTRNQFVNLYLENYQNLYYIRSAHALGEIGGAEAKKALAEALNKEIYRIDVKAAIQRALNKIK